METDPSTHPSSPRSPSNDIAVQRRAREGAQRPTRPSDCNGWLARNRSSSGRRIRSPEPGRSNRPDHGGDRQRKAGNYPSLQGERPDDDGRQDRQKAHDQENFPLSKVGLLPKRSIKELVHFPTTRGRRTWGAAPLRTDAPNEVWTIDFKGQFKTRDGIYCYPLTLLDHYSRYLLACRALFDVKTAGARTTLERVFREHGLPTAIRSDNGSPFGG